MTEEHHPKPAIAFWDREPIGYEMKPAGTGWVAYLIRQGSSAAWVPLASGWTEKGCKRRADAALAKEHRIWVHEHSVQPRRFFRRASDTRPTRSSR